MTQHVIIFARESAWQSLVSDAGTLATIVGAVGIGWLLGSEAMQWLGAITAFICLFARASRGPRLTPQEAADKLYHDFKVRAREGA